MCVFGGEDNCIGCHSDWGMTLVFSFQGPVTHSRHLLQKAITTYPIWLALFHHLIILHSHPSTSHGQAFGTASPFQSITEVTSLRGCGGCVVWGCMPGELWVQWRAPKCLTTDFWTSLGVPWLRLCLPIQGVQFRSPIGGSMKDMVFRAFGFRDCSICWFLWCDYTVHGWWQATNMMSLNFGVGKHCPQCAPRIWCEPVPAHHRLSHRVSLAVLYIYIRLGSLSCLSLPILGAGGSVLKNPPASAGDPGSIPGWGSSPGGGHGNPFQFSCLENPMDRGARRGTGVETELDTT